MDSLVSTLGQPHTIPSPIHIEAPVKRYEVQASGLFIRPTKLRSSWEYDATLPSSIYLQVPTTKFFSQNDLWWNDSDGFATADGKTVFFDPRLVHGGPPTLLADINDLLPRLDKIGCQLVWTLLGEKRVLGDTARTTPRICYSQLA